MRCALILALSIIATLAHAQSCKLDQINVPDGYTVELAATAPLVKHPLMACFDEQGRLYVAANAGRNLRREDLEKELPNYVQRLEDTDGDGVFDESVVFADKMTFPQGCLWYRGWLYVASSGAIWKMRDTDNDGRADERIKLVGDFGYTGNAADVHGPFLGREGRIYWCQGRHGHEFRDGDGNVTSRGKAARIFSCLPDGSDVQTWCTGGMDNPVEIVFTPEGDMLGTVNLMYARPRGDCLVHWQWGGVYPREDFVDQLGGEFYRTGELLREVHNYGHVALSGLCRYESKVFGDDAEGDLFITQFNTGKIICTKLQRKGATYEIASNRDFLTVDCEDFHPTDVLEDADGSLLVIDTGGWFRIGCPESQVAKPDVHGAIYRIRKKDAEPVKDPRGMEIDWDLLTISQQLDLLGDPRPAVREKAIEAFALISADNTFPEYHSFRDTPSFVQIRNFLWAIARRRIGEGFRTCALYAAGFGSKGSEDVENAASVHRTALAAWASLPLGEIADNEFPAKKVAQEQKGKEAGPLTAAFYYGMLAKDPANQVVGARLLAKVHRARTERFSVMEIVELAFTTGTDNERKPREIDPLVRHALIYALVSLGDRQMLVNGLNHRSERTSKLASVALEQLRRDLSSISDDDLFTIPSPQLPQRLDEAQIEDLLDLETTLTDGSIERGSAVFTNAKRANCAACHAIGNTGGRTGPDLTNIGDRRSRRDLLEAILYPSASFVRGFEPYAVITTEGKIYAGTIIGESKEAITLAIDPAGDQPNKAEIRRDQIEEIRATNVSIMPANVHEQLSPQELADLIAYLMAQSGEEAAPQLSLP